MRKFFCEINIVAVLFFKTFLYTFASYKYKTSTFSKITPSNKYTHAEIYLPSMFQSCVIEPMVPQQKL